MNIKRGLKAAAKSLFSPSKPESFRKAGKVIECPHCENILFRKRKGSLNTSASSLTGTEWLDHEAFLLICSNCSRIEWFHEEPENEKGV
jgi:DNA-directed RNA polymerase subunit RPC12/RpoP